MIAVWKHWAWKIWTSALDLNADSLPLNIYVECLQTISFMTTVHVFLGCTLILVFSGHISTALHSSFSFFTVPCGIPCNGCVDLGIGCHFIILGCVPCCHGYAPLVMGLDAVVLSILWYSFPIAHAMLVFNVWWPSIRSTSALNIALECICSFELHFDTNAYWGFWAMQCLM